MKRLLLASALALGLASQAHAVNFALPAVVLTGPPATLVTCTEVPASQLVVPLAAGAPIFNCVVTPSNWVGMPIVNPPYTIANNVGNTFSVVLAAAVTTPQTIAAQPADSVAP